MIPDYMYNAIKLMQDKGITDEEIATLLHNCITNNIKGGVTNGRVKRHS